MAIKRFGARGFGSSVTCAAVFAAAGLTGCGGRGGDDEPAEEGADGEVDGVVAELTNVPGGVACIRIDVSSGTAPISTNVSAGASSATIALGPLPVGQVTFTPAAFSVPCTSVGSTTVPTYVGEPVTVRVTPGQKPSIKLTLAPYLASSAGVDFVTPATALAAGYYQSYAIAAGTTVRAWGTNTYGQLGDGTVVTRTVPSATTQFAGVATIATGFAHTCIVTTGGALKCLGFGDKGQLGDGGTAPRSTIVTVIATGVAQVALGSQHTCARMTDGTVRCAGANDKGQLGNGTTSVAAGTGFAAITGLPAGGAMDISAGWDHTCLRDWNSAVYCWGGNDHGQIGNGATGVPVVSATALNEAAGLPFDGIAEIKAGVYATCARKFSGDVYCWGGNTFGQLGDGTIADKSRPNLVLGVSNAVQIGAGSNFACARIGDGTVRCWGIDNFGALGDGKGGIQSNVPTTVLGLTTAQDMAVGGAHVVVRVASGALVTWGSNQFNQLGDGTVETRFVPSPVSW